MTNAVQDRKAILSKYLLNCFLLTIPIMLWNIALADKLPQAFQPEVFWRDIPVWLTYGENISRIVVFMLTLFMPFDSSTLTKKKGWYLYIGGTILYFASWLVLIGFPYNSWSNHPIVFMAPAYTPLIWLVGIGLIGNSFYFKWPYQPRVFILASIVFLLFHNYHAGIIYFRTH